MKACPSRPFQRLYLTELTERFSGLFRPLRQHELRPLKELWVGFQDPGSLRLLEKLPDRGLAVVGTREPSTASVNFIRREIARLRGQDLIIVSGFARGIDTAAHTAALDNDLPTIAVLGCGLDRNYPATNENLRVKILAQGGLVISEYAPEEPAYASSFLDRNRLIAAWTKAALIVEAKDRSGALNTAMWARKMDRTVYAVPAFPGDPSFTGNRKLLDRDQAQCFWGADSLTPEWLELAELSMPASRDPNTTSQHRTEAAPDCPLLKKIAEATILKGGASIETILAWKCVDSVSIWSTLERYQKEGKIVERDGFICSSVEGQ